MEHHKNKKISIKELELYGHWVKGSTIHPVVIKAIRVETEQEKRTRKHKKLLASKKVTKKKKDQVKIVATKTLKKIQATAKKITKRPAKLEKKLAEKEGVVAKKIETKVSHAHIMTTKKLKTMLSHSKKQAQEISKVAVKATKSTTKPVKNLQRKLKKVLARERNKVTKKLSHEKKSMEKVATHAKEVIKAQESQKPSKIFSIDMIHGEKHHVAKAHASDAPEKTSFPRSSSQWKDLKHEIAQIKPKVSHKKTQENSSLVSDTKNATPPKNEPKFHDEKKLKAIPVELYLEDETVQNTPNPKDFHVSKALQREIHEILMFINEMMESLPESQKAKFRKHPYYGSYAILWEEWGNVD